MTPRETSLLKQAATDPMGIRWLVKVWGSLIHPHLIVYAPLSFVGQEFTSSSGVAERWRHRHMSSPHPISISYKSRWEGGSGRMDSQ